MKNLPVKFKFRLLRIFCMCAVIFLLPNVNFAQTGNQNDAPELKAGQTIEREMTGAETHFYKFDLKAGEFLQIRAEQKGVDVALKLFDADGKISAMMDSPNGAEGFEILSFVASKKGSFKLAIINFDETAAKGFYTVRREISRTANAGDKRRVENEKLFVEAMTARDAAGQEETAIGKLEEALSGWRELKDVYLTELTKRQLLALKAAKAVALNEEASKLFARKTEKSPAEALQKFVEAASLYGEAGYKLNQGIALLFAGQISNNTNDKTRTINLYKESLPLFQAVSDKNWEVLALHSIAFFYQTEGENEKALEFYFKALPLFKITQQKNTEAAALNNIGEIYRDAGENEKALEYFKRSLPISKEIGDQFQEATTLFNIGGVYSSAAVYQKAIEFYAQSLIPRRAVGDTAGEITTLLFIGKLYNFTGEKQKALDYFQQLLKTARETDNERVEITALNNIGKVYSDSGDKPKALEFYAEALPLTRKALDKKQEIETLSNLGAIYDWLGEREKALDYYDQSLSLSRELGDKFGEGTTLGNIGLLYSTIGESRKALEYFEQALTIARAVGDKFGEATTLGNIGGVYDRLGEKAKALGFYNQALILRRPADDKAFEARILNNIGKIYSNLGDEAKALEFLDKSLSLRRTVGDKLGEAVTLSNIGGVYYSLEKYRKALEFFKQALALSRSSGDKSAQAAALGNIGEIYSTLGEREMALDNFNESLSLNRYIGNRAGEAGTLNNLGTLYLSFGEHRKALEFLNKSLLINRALGEKEVEAATLNNLMTVWKKTGNLPIAAFYGKQSVNKYQELRGSVSGLNLNIQKKYLKSVEFVYRKLADLLIEQGSFAQAEQILAMLKQEEYFEFVRRDSSEIAKLDERVPLDKSEKLLLEKYSALAGKIAEIGREFVRLDDKKRQLSRSDLQLSAAEQILYEELEKQIDTANAAFRLFLEKELVRELGSRGEQVKKDIEIDRNLQAKLRKWGDGTVALYTVAGEDRYRVILTTAKVQIDGKTEIKIADLNKKVFAFRDALQNPNVDPRPLGKQLYDILIKPIEKELKQANAKTLIWSLDGTLRYIPLAALSPDGKKYLVEDFQNVIITPKTRDDVSDSSKEWQALGLGVSEPLTVINPDDKNKEIPFSKLPGTERELLAIVKDEKSDTETGVLVGRRFMNRDFTIGAFKDSLAKETVEGNRKYNVIHIASHFRLGNKDSNSFILLGNGQILTLEEIRNSSTIDFGDVELVTLSACSTGFADDSNGKEVDSLASVIQTKSGKAVLATLWAVADESTSLLMSEFYRLRKENTELTKAEAIQIAQQKMIGGSYKTKEEAAKKRSDLINLSGEDKNQPKYERDKNAPFAHPFYWSPFVLIGNWR